MSVVDTAKARLARAREASPLLDHLVRMAQHYGSVNGNGQAGAVTYFGFLSFFPIMALAFFAVGLVSRVYGGAESQLLDVINQVLPGMVSEDGADGTIALSDVEQAAAAAAGFGVVGLLYSGLNWLSGMREALMAVFELPEREQPNLVVGKGKDLLSLILIGVTLMVSVAVAGLVTGFSETILDWVGLDAELSWAVVLLGVVVGLMTNMVLFYALFRLLADPHTPTRALWSGALLGALGFELLKQLSAYLMASTKEQPAFQAFGIALILLIWINYFSRVVILAASWAHTAPVARAAREAEAVDDRTPEGPRIDVAALAGAGPARGAGTAGVAPPGRAGPFAAGAASMLGMVALLRRRRR